MERKSRVNKFRDLRESLKDDASLPEQVIEEVIDEDDTPIPTLREYRAKQFVQEVKESFTDDVSELEGITAELDSREVEEAISRVRMTSGKGQQYNTRLDILNHIQSVVKRVDQAPIVYPDDEDDEIEEVVHNTEEIKPVKHMSIFFEEEDEDETKEIEIEEEPQEIFEEEIEEEPKRKFSLFKKRTIEEEYDEDDEYEEEYLEEDDDDYEDDEVEESTVLMKVLSGLIVVLSLCLVGLLVYIIKLFVF